jgi:hypothetical protein
MVNLRAFLKRLVVALMRLLPGRKRVALLIDPMLPSATHDVLKRAASVFSGVGGVKIDLISGQLTTVGVRALCFRFGGLAVTGRYRDRVRVLPTRVLPTFEVDPLQNPLASWNWHNVIKAVSPIRADRIQQSKLRFVSLIESLAKSNHRKCYIFGTGPSLEKAAAINFDDGYKIICNTICKDRDFFMKIKPHILVAGDALYHFSETKHAQAFQRDVEQRMEEANFTFCYPALFDAFVRRRFPRFEDRLIPIPVGKAFDLTVDMTREFYLPVTGNTLGLLLLPIACQLAKNILMLGFDGRRPTDKFFWANSIKHSYPDLTEEMAAEYPAFYSHFLPKEKPLAYVTSVHGDALDEAMTMAEKKGWSFTLLSPSTSPALARRPVVQR